MFINVFLWRMRRPKRTRETIPSVHVPRGTDYDDAYQSLFVRRRFAVNNGCVSISMLRDVTSK